jgi:GNAT superfamily N-acetyltransferase
MQFETITGNDLSKIRYLQPEGWSDIIPEFESYIHHDFCYPIKTVIHDEIVGVGVLIAFTSTAWLAHIIVAKEHRNKGVGFQIVQELLGRSLSLSIGTSLLIATEAGLPVYKKAGFRIVTDYLFFTRDEPWHERQASEKIMNYCNDFCKMVLDLDKKISGENRASLIRKYLDTSKVFIEKRKVLGYYIPDLGEGMIMADAEYAGLELMKIKYAKADKAVIPSDNQAGITFLKQNGFKETDTKGIRMIFGKDIDWDPLKIFSRTGGNYG